MKYLLFAFLFLISNSIISQNHYAQKTLDSLEIVLAKTSNDSVKISVMTTLGHHYGVFGNKKSLTFSNQALKLAKRTNSDIGIVDSYISFSVYYDNKRDTIKPLEYLNRALKVANKKKDANNLGKVYYELASYYWGRDENKKTEHYFSKCVDLFSKSKNKKALADTFLNFGYYYATIKDYNSALKYYKRHAALFESGNILLVNTYMVIIDLYTTQLNFDKALEYCELSKELYLKNKETNNIHYHFLQNNFGDLYKRKKQYQKSLEAYNVALQYFRKMENYRECALIYTSKAEVYQELQQKNKVLENINLALEIIKKEIECASHETLNTKVGYIYFSMQDYPNALKHHLNAYYGCTVQSQFKEIDTQEYNVGATYLKLAQHINQIVTENKDIPKSQSKLLKLAEEFINNAINKALKKGDLSMLKSSYLLKSEIGTLQKDNNKAFKNYKLHIQYKDSLATVENRELLVQNQMQFEFDQKDKVQKAEQERKDALSREELSNEKNNRNIALGGIGFFVIVAGFSGFAYVQKRKDNKIISDEKQKSDDLLLNILPAEIAKELKEKGSSEAKHFDSVSIMFTDFKDFTKLSEKIPSTELIYELNYCFKEFDNIITKHGVEKIKTIGDSYMAVCGLPAKHGNHAQKMVEAALEIRDFIEHYKAKRQLEGKSFFEMRIGINSGEVVAGIVGIKKFAYDIWGDAVNTASRMESNGVIGKVNISEATHKLVEKDFSFDYRGEIEVKGKGKINMYFVEPKKENV